MEVKAIGKDLRDTHLRQAVDYAANEGVDWIVLTNGAQYQAHRVRFEKPVQHDMIFDVDLLAPDAKPADLLETLYLLSRDAAATHAMEKYRATKEATNRFILAQLVLSDSSVKLLRRELRRLSPGLKVTDDEIARILASEVLKRDVVEGERAKAARATVKRAMKRKVQSAEPKPASPTPVGAESPKAP